MYFYFWIKISFFLFCVYLCCVTNYENIVTDNFFKVSSNGLFVLIIFSLLIYNIGLSTSKPSVIKEGNKGFVTQAINISAKSQVAVRMLILYVIERPLPAVFVLPSMLPTTRRFVQPIGGFQGQLKFLLDGVVELVDPRAPVAEGATRRTVGSLYLRVESNTHVGWPYF